MRHAAPLRTKPGLGGRASCMEISVPAVLACGRGSPTGAEVRDVTSESADMCCREAVRRLHVDFHGQ